MCTVIYLPQKNGFLLSSNRDESPQRKIAIAPIIREYGDSRILGPVDAEAGGTWMATNDKGETIVLFNGAFSPHIKQERYKRSRGLIVPELLASESVLSGWEKLDAGGVEPFSIIVADGRSLYRLTWDGRQRYKMQLDPLLPRLWSSVTLYDAATRMEREKIFRDWLSLPGFQANKDRVLTFLREAMPADPEKRFIMQREKVQTVSVTVLQQDAGGAEYFYHDLRSGRYEGSAISFTMQSAMNH